MKSGFFWIKNQIHPADKLLFCCEFSLGFQIEQLKQKKITLDNFEEIYELTSKLKTKATKINHINEFIERVEQNFDFWGRLQNTFGNEIDCKTPINKENFEELKSKIQDSEFGQLDKLYHKKPTIFLLSEFGDAYDLVVSIYWKKKTYEVVKSKQPTKVSNIKNLEYLVGTELEIFNQAKMERYSD